MLVLTRRLNEEIVCVVQHPDGTTSQLKIVVLSSNHSRAKIGINAPKSITVYRGEKKDEFDKES